MSSSRGRTLILGQLFGQGAQLLALPFVARHYPPSDYGYLQTATAIALLLLPVSTLRVEFMIPVRPVADAQRMSRIGYATSVGFTLLCVVGSAAAGIADEEIWRDVLVMISAVLFAQAWITLDNAWLIRDGELGRLGARNAIAGFLTASLQIGVALLQQPIVYLALAILAGRLLATALTYRRRRHSELERATSSHAYSRRRAVSTISAGVLSAASVQTLVLFCAAFIGPYEAGLVGMAQRIAGLPVVLVGQSLSQFVQARTAENLEPGHLTPVFQDISKKLALLGAGTALPLLILAPIFSTPILGPDWRDTGVIIALLAIPLGLQVVMAPLAVMFVILDRSNSLLVLQMVRTAAATALAAIGLLTTGDIVAVVALYAVGTAAAYVAQWFYLRSVVAHGDAAT